MEVCKISNHTEPEILNQQAILFISQLDNDIALLGFFFGGAVKMLPQPPSLPGATVLLQLQLQRLFFGHNVFFYSFSFSQTILEVYVMLKNSSSCSSYGTGNVV